MSEKIFKDRKEAIEYFSTVESGSAYYSDEDGELKHILKNKDDQSRFSQLLTSFASAEENGEFTSLDDIEALIQQGKELGYEYTPNDIRIKIAKLRKNKKF